MIIEGCIATLKAGGLIEVWATPAFTIKTKRNIVKSMISKIERDKRFKRVPRLKMDLLELDMPALTDAL